MDCPVKQKLVTVLVKCWAYLGCVEELAAPMAEMVGGSLTEAVNKGPVAMETRAAVRSGREKVKAKKKGLRKRKGDNVGLVAKKVRN